MRTTCCLLGTGITLGLIGGSLLVAFGLMYVKLYMLVRYMEPVTCITVDGELSRDFVSCQCGWDGRDNCVSRYPCITIRVNVTGHGVMLENITLFDSYETFALHGSKLQCSFHKCSRSSATNVEAIKSSTDSLSSVGTKFDCFYLPSKPTYAIKDVVTLETVVHCMVWPSLAVIVGVILLFSLLCKQQQRSERRLLSSAAIYDSSNQHDHNQYDQNTRDQQPVACSSLERAWNKRRNYEPVSAVHPPNI